jgi:hypothetical protein
VRSSHGVFPFCRESGDKQHFFSQAKHKGALQERNGPVSATAGAVMLFNEGAMKLNGKNFPAFRTDFWVSHFFLDCWTQRLICTQEMLLSA